MKAAALFCLLFAIGFISAQNDTSVFKTIKKIQAQDYVFTVPESWTAYLQQQNGPQLQKLEFTDIALPHLVNDAPLTAMCFFRKITCDSIRAAQEFVVTEFSSYPDRITPSGQDYKRDTLNIATGEQAILYSTHYLRRSKAYNFTRYDMVVYSIKRKAAYWFTASYQYKDPTYKTEEDYKLKQYALRVFKTLQLR
jgi:hypothetical protein